MRKSAFVLGAAVVAITFSGHPPTGKPRAVQKQYQQTYSCTKNARQLVAEMQRDFSLFADYEATLCTTFCTSRVMPGENIRIFTGLWGYRKTLEVRVVAADSNSFSFESVKGKHVLYPASIKFAAADVGTQVRVTIAVDADVVGGPARWTFPIIGGQLEDKTWNHYLSRVNDFCK